MLHSFTWLQFLVATLIFTIIWYVIILLLYGRTGISQLFSNHSITPERIRKEWDDEIEEDFSPDVPFDNGANLIGQKKEPNGVSEVEMHMLNFSPHQKKDNNLNQSHQEVINTDARLGLIPDLIEELKEIFNVMKKEGGTREDFISLFDLVKGKYPAVANLENKDSLVEFILSNVPFQISEPEIKALFS